MSSSSTELGFVTPGDDDPVDIPEDMRGLAVSVDDYLQPQFATIQPRPAPWDGMLYLTRVGAQVIMQGGVRNAGLAPPGDFVIIGAVPPGMLPVTEVVLPGSVAPGTGVEYHLRIDPSGAVQFRHFAASTGNTMAVSLVWATAVGA